MGNSDADFQSQPDEGEDQPLVGMPTWDDPMSNIDGVPPILTATVHMDECVKVVRNHLAQPFPDPPPESAENNFTRIWLAAEKACRQECEDGIELWLLNRTFPILDDDASFFLVRRLDQASIFLQSLFDEDHESPFMALRPVDEMLRWSLTTWWENHGWLLAVLEDEGGMMDRLFPRRYD